MTKALAIPAVVAVAAKTAKLGRFDQAFRYRGRTSEWFVFSFLLFTTSTCWADAAAPSYRLEAPRSVAVGLAVFMTAITLGQLVQLQLRRRKRVFLYANGLVTANGFGQIKRIVRWGDVAIWRQKFRADIYLPSMEGALIDGSTRAWLTLRDGTRVRFAGSIKDSDALMAALYEKIGRAQLPALLKQWEGLSANAAMTASGYHITRAGITVPQRLWPRREIFIRWEDVKSINTVAPLAPSFYRYPGGSTTLQLSGRPNPSATVFLFMHIVRSS